MRNDINIPPGDADEPGDPPEAVHAKPIQKKVHKPVTGPAIPPAEGKLVADVELYDRPDMSPSGDGNFWSLGIFSLIIAIIAGLVLYLISHYMR